MNHIRLASYRATGFCGYLRGNGQNVGKNTRVGAVKCVLGKVRAREKQIVRCVYPHGALKMNFLPPGLSLLMELAGKADVKMQRGSKPGIEDTEVERFKF